MLKALVLTTSATTKRKSLRDAAIDGTAVLAFLPMLFTTGRLSRFTEVLPLAMIAILLFSLAEALTVLLSHLAHADGLGMKSVSWLLGPSRYVCIGISRLAELWILLDHHHTQTTRQWSGGPLYRIRSVKRLRVIGRNLVRTIRRQPRP